MAQPRINRSTRPQSRLAALLTSPKARSAMKSALLTASIAVFTATNAGARELSIDLHDHAPTDPRAGLFSEPATTVSQWDASVGLWTRFQFDSLVLRDPTGQRDNLAFIGDQLTGDVVFNLGVLDRLSVGLNLPFVYHQTGDPISPADSPYLANPGLTPTAFGDLHLVAKLTLLPPTGGDLGGWSVAALQRLGLPTGSEGSGMGEGHVLSETRVLVDYTLLVAGVHATLGARIRGEQENVGCTSADVECATAIRHEIPFGLGLSFRPFVLGIDPDANMTWRVETYGRLPAFPSSPFSNEAVSRLQLAASVNYQLERDAYVMVGAEAGLLSGIGQSPLRMSLVLGWAPRTHDADGDGVHDDKDVCPDIEEDIDGHEDDDGCPDWDDDGDGVPDTEDQCPNEREDEDGYKDDDGCPDLDNDGDGLADDVDACPNEAGIDGPGAVKPGCPDADGDGVKNDRCPLSAEDKDGLADEDGCPETDVDADGVDDKEDACPTVPGVRYPKRKADDGCPDADGDGIADKHDQCPQQPGDDGEKLGCPKEPPPSKKK